MLLLHLSAIAIASDGLALIFKVAPESVRIWISA
jgi:hypothetical protein